MNNEKIIFLIRDFLTFLVIGFGVWSLIWKALDAWGKRIAIPMKEVMDKMNDLENWKRTINDEMISIKSTIKQQMDIIISYFKQ